MKITSKIYSNCFEIPEAGHASVISRSVCSGAKSTVRTSFGIAVCLICSFLICVVSGCGFLQRGGSGSAAKPNAPEVIVEGVVQNDVQLYLYAQAKTVPYKSVDIRVRVAGYLRQYFYSHGEVVELGSRLAQIEPEQYQYALEISKQELIIAQQKEIQAKKDLDRDLPLLKVGARTPEEILQRETEHKTAIANVKRCEVAVQQAELNLQYTDIKAPIGGKTTQHLVDENNFISPGSGEAKILSITQLDPIYVDFSVSDKEFADLKDRWGYRDKFEEVTQKTQDNPDNKIDAGNTKDKKKNTTTNDFTGFSGGTFEVSLTSSSAAIPSDFPLRGQIKGVIDNRIIYDTGQVMIRGELRNPLLNIKGSSDYLIYAGQICRVRIPYETVSDAILISEEALLTDLDTKYVFVVQKGMYQPPVDPLAGANQKAPEPFETEIAYRRDVKIGRLLDNQQRIILQGLKAGEKYIIKGVQRARHKSPVTSISIDEFNERRAKEEGIGTTNEDNTTPNKTPTENRPQKAATGTNIVQPPVNKD